MFVKQQVFWESSITVVIVLPSAVHSSTVIWFCSLAIAYIDCTRLGTLMIWMKCLNYCNILIEHIRFSKPTSTRACFYVEVSIMQYLVNILVVLIF
jgi:hypothetical protein